MDTLKNIIFDLGGVLLNINYKLTAKAFADLGVVDFENMYGQFSADDLFEKLETGHITEDHFFHVMKSRTGSLTTETTTQAWNAMVLDFRMESLEFLEKISDKYNLYLLSNTNIIHKTNFDKVFKQETGRDSIDNYFQKVYYSHLIGLRKPNADVFEYVLNDAGIKASETLFIDDSINNIETARSLGIQTHLLLPHERIEGLDILT